MRKDSGFTLHQWFLQGSLSLPLPFLKHYSSLGIDDEEMMLLIQLMAFQQLEANHFPSLDDLVLRLACDRQEAMRRIQQLVDKGLLQIEVETQQAPTQPIEERYDLGVFFRRCMEAFNQQYVSSEGKATKDNLFSLFEGQFARPLTPMEYEILSAWLDQDGYSEELIVAALKEAIISGKLAFRYIDRILLEWQRNQVTTPQEARLFSQRFHTASPSDGVPQTASATGEVPSITFYNWLESQEKN